MEPMTSHWLDETLLAPFPQRVHPMWVAEERRAFDRGGWVFEVKYDGYRAVAELGESGVKLYSRNLKDLGRRFPAIVTALRHMGSQAVMDGELVIIGDDGKPDFQALRGYFPDSGADLRYFVFDLLWLDAYDLTSLPLLRRMSILENLVTKDRTAVIQYVDHVETEGVAFFEAIIAQGLEGMVAKKADSSYRIDEGTPRTRRGEWVKVKHYIRHGWEEKVVRGAFKP